MKSYRIVFFNVLVLFLMLFTFESNAYYRNSYYGRRYNRHRGRNFSDCTQHFNRIDFTINNYTGNLYLFDVYGTRKLAMETESRVINKEKKNRVYLEKPNVVTRGSFYYSQNIALEAGEELKIRIIPVLPDKPLKPGESVYYYCGKETYADLPIIRIDPLASCQYSKVINFKGHILCVQAKYEPADFNLTITIYEKNSKVEL